MKNIITTLIVLFSFNSIKAQDIIVKNDKTEIKAKIEEITETTIKYKKFEMLDGPTYNINKRDIFMVIYKNGTKEYIESSGNQPAVVNTQPTQENRQTTTSQSRTSSSTIFPNSNTYSTGETIEQRGNRYYYKGQAITSFKQMTSIFEENHAEGSISHMKKRQTFISLGLGLTGIGAIGYVIFGLGDNPNRTLSNVSIGALVVGGVCGLISGGQTKKAISEYNSSVRKLSFVPTFKIDQQGNHAGITMNF